MISPTLFQSTAICSKPSQFRYQRVIFISKSPERITQVKGSIFKRRSTYTSCPNLLIENKKFPQNDPAHRSQNWLHNKKPYKTITELLLTIYNRNITAITEWLTVGNRKITTITERKTVLQQNGKGK